MNDNGRRHQSIDLRWSASSDGGLAAIRGFVAQVAFWGEGRQGGGGAASSMVPLTQRECESEQTSLN
jgi:hypothetical protein